MDQGGVPLIQPQISTAITNKDQPSSVTNPLMHIIPIS